MLIEIVSPGLYYPLLLYYMLGVIRIHDLLIFGGFKFIVLFSSRKMGRMISTLRGQLWVVGTVFAMVYTLCGEPPQNGPTFQEYDLLMYNHVYIVYVYIQL